MRRAQASIEYIATYGWVLLGVLLSVGAMAYYGAFDLNRYRAQECLFSPGLVCEDFLFNESGNQLHLVLRNDYGVDIELTSLNGSVNEQVIFNCDSLNTDPAFGIQQVREILCSASIKLIEGQFYDVTLRGSFNQKGNPYQHNITGFVRGRAN